MRSRPISRYHLGIPFDKLRKTAKTLGHDKLQLNKVLRVDMMEMRPLTSVDKNAPTCTVTLITAKTETRCNDILYLRL